MNDNFNDNMEHEELGNDVDVNRENEEFYNSLMEESKRKSDDYWDRNNPIVKGILIVLLIVGIVGFIYYLILGLNMK